MNVSAVIVTRGNVDLEPIMDSLPREWELLVWDNGERHVCAIQSDPGGGFSVELSEAAQDLSVYGRYAAIEHASGDLIYVQDDDCVVVNPQAIVDLWQATNVNDPRSLLFGPLDDFEAISRGEHVVANMPARFRHAFYEDHCLVGFGACFHRDAPRRAFERFWQTDELTNGLPSDEMLLDEGDWFHRTCDVVFTGLTPRVLTDVQHVDAPYASDSDRMWKQAGHQAEREKMLDLVRRQR